MAAATQLIQIAALQITMHVVKFRNCKPHYLWVNLVKRIGDREVSAGELHLRVQWSSEELNRPTESLPTLALEVSLHGVGLSIIEASVLKLPREV